MKFLTIFIFSIASLTVQAQSTFIPVQNDYQQLAERYQILHGKLSSTIHFSVQPMDRKSVFKFASSLGDSVILSKSDNFNKQYLMNDSWEWSEDTTINQSKKPILKHFYQKKSDLYNVSTNGLDLHVNPVLYFMGGKENNSSDINFINTRGIEVRGMIDRKVGFYAFAADNQALFPGYVRTFRDDFHAVPNEGYYKKYNNSGANDFFTARGYITFNATKHILLQFGHDKNFIGNGYRSLILSDFSSPYTFLKANVKVWRINYMTMFAQLNAGTRNFDTLFPKKFFAFHHLSVNLNKNINIGLFESVIFGRGDTNQTGRFDINYLNPIIFYRSIEQQLGSSDNALLGMNYNIIFLRHFSAYGQVVLDEFLLSQVRSGNGWWANKQAFQYGLKYINVAGIKNLDIQAEYNKIRPYTYTHHDVYTNYTHYNQPLAHPLGANLKEAIMIMRYQPLPRLSLTLKYFDVLIGKDTSTTNLKIDNYGSNIFKSNTQVAKYHTYGNFIGQGVRTNIHMLSLSATWQFRHNVFIDGNVIYRKEQSAIPSRNNNTIFLNVAFRMNIAKRLQEF